MSSLNLSSLSGKGRQLVNLGALDEHWQLCMQGERLHLSHTLLLGILPIPTGFN